MMDSSDKSLATSFGARPPGQIINGMGMGNGKRPQARPRYEDEMQVRVENAYINGLQAGRIMLKLGIPRFETEERIYQIKEDFKQATSQLGADRLRDTAEKIIRRSERRIRKLQTASTRKEDPLKALAMEREEDKLQMMVLGLMCPLVETKKDTSSSSGSTIFTTMAQRVQTESRTPSYPKELEGIDIEQINRATMTKSAFTRED